MGDTNIPTNDLSGKLRMVKAGNTVTGYYYDNGNWISILSHGTSGDVGVNLRAWNHEVSFYAPVKIAFDNFIVNKGDIVVPEPASIVSLAIGALTAISSATLGMRRKK